MEGKLSIFHFNKCNGKRDCQQDSWTPPARKNWACGSTAEPLYKSDFHCTNHMGKTQRKTNKYLELYRKSLKKKVDTVLGFTPPFTTKEDFLCLFEEVYPDDVLSMQRHFKFYQEKNKRRTKGKPLIFPPPSELLYEIAGSKVNSVSKSKWNHNEAEEKRKATLLESKKEQEKKKENIEKIIYQLKMLHLNTSIH